ncbi:MAG: 16S rRNA (uracil(1498)-N(3))-methyltransferase [Cyanobacteria bacterium J06639_14]
MQRVVITTEQIQDQILSLSREQQHYLIRVLRLQVGDRFLALNGEGKLWLATLMPTGAQASLANPEDTSALDPISAPAKPRITLAACLPKQGFDEVVRQVTELGIDQIVPIISDRTLLRPSPSKLQRWRRIAAEAAEQSERLIVPKIYDPIVWSKWLVYEPGSYRCFCVARYTAVPLLSICFSADRERIVVAIGPEGGWTTSEIRDATSVGYQPVTLGMGILRAVTASVAAISILQSGFEFASIEPQTNTKL